VGVASIFQSGHHRGVLQRSAYQQYLELHAEDDGNVLSFTAWCEEQSNDHPQFLYWCMTLSLELLVLQFVKSLREGSFHLYIETLAKLVPWMCALDRTHYSLPVHIRDMVQLERRHPTVYQQFQQGHFTVQKTEHRFSSIALDQNHEQLNDLIKGEGGAVGLTESPTALLRWMVAGPEIARIVNEFDEYQSKEPEKHHEQSRATQAEFMKDVLELVEVIQTVDNPFLDDGKDLLTLDTKVVMDNSAVQTLKIIEACQSRSGNLTEFFSHENQACPPSLSEMGKLRHCSKSDLLSCLQITGPVPVITDIGPSVEAEVLDGAAIVHMLPPRGIRTNFSDYAGLVFIPHIRQRLQHVQRLDIVWNRYMPDSLKQSTRESRGSGRRRKVTETTPLPRNWQSFLQADSNKAELFEFLANRLSEETPPRGKEIVTTLGASVKCTDHDRDTSKLEPCTHEEADTHIMIHVADCVAHGYQKISIRTIDTDVVVLAVSLDILELWVAFGTGKSFKHIGAHNIASNLGRERSTCLPLFHSLTGWDTVCSFTGRGKKTCWDVWGMFEPLTQCLLHLASVPVVLEADDLGTIQRFVVLLYSRT